MARGFAPSIVARIAGLAAIALLETHGFLQPTSLSFRALTAGVVLASVWKPVYGLMIFAALSPLTTALAAATGAAGQGSLLLEQMVLAIGAGVLIGNPWAGDRTRLGAPMLLLAVIAAASAASLLPALSAPFAPGLFDARVFEPLARRTTVLTSSVWTPVNAALLVAQCGLLAWSVERLARRTAGLVPRLLMIAVAGHAAAAALNLKAIAGFAQRAPDGLGSLGHMLMTARVSAQMDWNAAASAFLLAGVAGLALLARDSARDRVVVTVLLILVALGLWTTGSRIGIVMAAVAIVCAAGWWLVQTGLVRKQVAAAAGLIVFAGLIALVVVDPFDRNDPVTRSAGLRRTMAAAGFQMLERAPVFGIGIDRFYEESAAYIGPFMKSVGGGARENAHNNFVQVLAEQGIVGLCALLLAIGAVLVSAARAGFSRQNPLRDALTLAIAACVGTWLTGHPLLVAEFACVFWFYCGLLAATTPAPQVRSRWWLPLAVAVILVSVPFRAAAGRDAADLEHLGFGLSMWQHDDEQRYRQAGGSFALYLPATGRPVDIPLRTEPGAPRPLIVNVMIGNREAHRVTVAGDRWEIASITLPAGRRRFELVDFVVQSAAGAPPASGALLRVGKAVGR